MVDKLALLYLDPFAACGPGPWPCTVAPGPWLGHGPWPPCLSSNPPDLHPDSIQVLFFQALWSHALNFQQVY